MALATPAQVIVAVPVPGVDVATRDVGVVPAAWAGLARALLPSTRLRTRKEALNTFFIATSGDSNCY